MLLESLLATRAAATTTQKQRC